MPVLATVLAAATTAEGQESFDEPLETKHKATFKASVTPSDPFSELNLTTPPKGVQTEFTRGEVVYLTIEGTLAEGWHTYPLTRRTPDQDSAQLTKVTYQGTEHVTPLYPIYESPAEFDKVLDQVLLEHHKPFTWVQPLYIKPDAPAGKPIKFTVKIKAQVCAKTCVNEDHQVAVTIPVSSAPAVQPTPEVTKLLAAKPPELELVYPDGKKPTETAPTPATAPKSGSSGSSGDSSAKVAKALPVRSGLVASIVKALIGGYVSLLTPCVFPMIPITVSFFLKQAENKKNSAVFMAAVYSLTIVVVLAAGGIALQRSLVEISQHPVTNFALGALFLFFAMSLLGMYDITLPSFLQDMTSAREGRGGLIGACFMALTFSIISFACVGPIYGGFISLEASQQSSTASNVDMYAGVIAFAVAFASPFFILALFPSLLHTMPRSGSWMNSVKVVMGFLELAAVFKFMRAAELAWTGKSEYLTFDFSLGIYVALCLACGLYLLGVYRLPHDHGAPESISVPRLMFSLAFISLGLYLTPALFKNDNGEPQAPRGQLYTWVESFLLPEAPTGNAVAATKAGNGSSQHEEWGRDLPQALAKAQKENKLIFLDITGLQCTNCRLNERGAFPRPEVKAALAQHVLLQLYADMVPAGMQQNPGGPETTKLRNEVFKNNALPYYALLRPKGDSFELVRSYEYGLIQDIPGFLEFLKPE